MIHHTGIMKQNIRSSLQGLIEYLLLATMDYTSASLHGVYISMTHGQLLCQHFSLIFRIFSAALIILFLTFPLAFMYYEVACQIKSKHSYVM